MEPLTTRFAQVMIYILDSCVAILFLSWCVWYGSDDEVEPMASVCSVLLLSFITMPFFIVPAVKGGIAGGDEFCNNYWRNQTLNHTDAQFGGQVRNLNRTNTSREFLLAFF